MQRPAAPRATSWPSLPWVPALLQTFPVVADPARSRFGVGSRAPSSLTLSPSPFRRERGSQLPHPLGKAVMPTLKPKATKSWLSVGALALTATLLAGCGGGASDVA